MGEQTPKKTNKLIALLLAIVALLGGGGYTAAKLGSSRVDAVAQSAQATTTLNWMRPGLGTTTLTAQTQGYNSLVADVILAASSSQTRLKARVERSRNNNDWFAHVGSVQELASSTAVTSTFSELSISFNATSTAGTSQDVNYSGTGTTSANFISFAIPTLGAPYTRIVFYLEENGTAPNDSGAIWARIQATEENSR